ncbi:hypothetical protein CSA17_03660 [bacterium DOLJORAL78_65_58]|nr:MAG: hypothetical protein CSB20_07585 [bacterium DOLZORAL124_64_63]PIE76155.1 MAG: hypothetical protein CSA17_03660 [bacterium DOLJORAL78_65_58]
MHFQKPHRGVGFFLLLVAMTMPLQGLAQVAGSASAGRLTAGDVIDIRVPGRPDLSMILTLDTRGKIVIPQVGSVSLEGLTTSEAELILRQRMRLFDPTLDTVKVERQSVEEQGAVFYLIGQVEHPGQFTFSYTPTLWELFREAGGPLDNANLRQVRLVREDGGKTQVTQFDLSELLEGGQVPDIGLKPGDTLVVPALLDGVSGVSTETGVKVMGAVSVPTVVAIDQPTPLLDVLMLAGSPSADSEIRKVQWVHEIGDVPRARVVNLREYLDRGNPMGNPLVYPGDTVRVEYYQEPWYRSTLPLILGTAATVATVWLAYDRVQNDR